MAIVTDPDNMDRYQVIYGTDDQDVSINPCGSLVHATFDDTNGVTVDASKTFTASGLLFSTNGASPGDILCIYTGAEAGHYVIDTVDSETQLTLLMNANFSGGDTGHVWQIRDPDTGSMADGVTGQATYSFSKEEWRTDSETWGSDDLIRHEFPLQAITPNQLELGGSTTFGAWNYFGGGSDTTYSRKKIRFAGWEAKNSSGTRIDMYGGFLSLGTMNTDAQAYFQQEDSTTAPQDFEFLGPVNEAVLTHDGGAGDYTDYFKGFLRQKYYSYSSYDLLTEQPNLGSLSNLLYSFPLSHSSDAAISAHDAETEGNSPWTNYTTVVNNTDGITTVSTGTFTNTSATDFAAAGVVVGDILYLSTGNDVGYYTISNVATTTITVEINNADFTTFAGDTGITFAVHTNDIVTGLTDGALADVDGDTGTCTSATDYAAAGVAANDMLIITEAASAHMDVYKINSVATTVLTCDTSDRIFTTQSDHDHYVVEPGMYLSYKEETITIASPGNITMNENGGSPDDITRTSGSWITDGITTGSVITISGATNSENNNSFTVASTTALVATLVATDDVVQEGPSALTVTAYDAFKRTVDSVVYAFHWRLFGNDGTLSECYEYAQKQSRETADIDWSLTSNRGDITDILFDYATPTGTTNDMYIDDLATADVNNVTFIDATGASRTEKFLAAGSIGFNDNLVNDAGPAKYWMFFLNDDPPGDDTGADYGTPNAIIVQESDSSPINGNVSGSSVNFDYDYDNNAQRGNGAKGTDAPVVCVGIGLATAQFGRTDYTLLRSKANNISIVASLERNYST